MSLKQVLENLNHIKSLPGRNDKIKSLKQYLEDEVFKRVITFALNSNMTYKVKKFPPYNELRVIPSSIDKIFIKLNQLNNQEGASNDDKAELYGLASIDPETYEVVKRICNKDLKCGVAAKSINKALPDTIFLMPYCRCSSDKEMHRLDPYWEEGVHFQDKEDGMFVDVICDYNGKIKIKTREGKKVKQLGKLKAELKASPYFDHLKGLVLTCETLILMDNGEVLDRQTGNGILNKLIHGTAPQHEVDRVLLRSWDAIPIDDFWKGECDVIYDARFDHIKSIVNMIDLPNRLQLVRDEIVYSLEEAKDCYADVRAKDGEGGVLKARTAKWKDHTSPLQIKMKNVSDCDLRITGWKYGKEGSKYEDVVGAFFAESQCQQLTVTVNVRTDEMREWNWDDLTGEIAEVEFNEVSKAKNKDTHSLSLPRFVKIKADRYEADTLEEIIAREQTKKKK